MKRFPIVLTLSVILTSGVVVPSFAQDQATASQKGAVQPMTPDDVVDTLAAKLNLSDDQKTQIKPIIADRQQKLQALRGDTSSRPMQKMRKMKSIFNDSDNKIEAVLNDQQKQQYIQMEQQMRQQIRQRMQNRGASGGDSTQ